jgi:hypothetical protein
MGLEAPEPPKDVRSFIFLCHAPNVTLSEEQLARARLGSSAREPSGISGLRLVFLCPGLVLHR